MQTSMHVEAGPRNRFNDALLEAISKSLKKILGESSAKAVYSDLEKEGCLNRESEPVDLEQFQLALKEIFGKDSLIIEKTIIKNLSLLLSLHKPKFHLKYENNEPFQFCSLRKRFEGT